MVNKYAKELLTPSGEKYIATSPIEANDLIYGSGYREVSEQSEQSGPEAKKTAPAASDKPATPTQYASGGQVSP